MNDSLGYCCQKFALWPASGDRDSSERNLVHHFAASLQRLDYAVFFEFFVGARQRMDLVAVHRQGKRVVLCEAKNAYDKEHASLLLDDIERLERFADGIRSPESPIPGAHLGLLSGCRDVASVLLVSCWNWKQKSVAKAWLSRNPRFPELRVLRAKLGKLEAHRDWKTGSDLRREKSDVKHLNLQRVLWAIWSPRG